MVTLDLETSVITKSGITFIAGLDEAGRGALAGPVVAAAVMLPDHSRAVLERLAGVDDSKLLSAPTREQLFTVIQRTALSYGIGSSSAQTIDRHGIIAATRLAMYQAVAQLNPPAGYLLIDGRIRLSRLSLPQESIEHGDSLCLSIAAASILAKVTRDRMMIALDTKYAQYGFARHKGYGTVFHRDALARLGPTPEHRRTFNPLRTTLV